MNLAFTDSKRFFYGQALEGIGTGITVGVVDSGNNRRAWPCADRYARHCTTRDTAQLSRLR